MSRSDDNAEAYTDSEATDSEYEHGGATCDDVVSEAYAHAG